MDGTASPTTGNGKRKDVELSPSLLLDDGAGGGAGSHKRLKRLLTQESDLKVFSCHHENRNIK